jgi:hypothetical protein
MSMLIGAVTLARAVNSEALSQQIARAAEQTLLR